MLRWLKMNHLLGETSTEMQVDFLGTRLKDDAAEWFFRNIELHNCAIHDWSFEDVVIGLQKRFLLTLTHHRAANQFDSLRQDTHTVQELYTELCKFSERMVYPPDEYTFR